MSTFYHFIFVFSYIIILIFSAKGDQYGLKMELNHLALLLYFSLTIQMTVYYDRTSLMETVDFSLDAGGIILDYFNTLFEVSYPLPNLGNIFIRTPEPKVSGLSDHQLSVVCPSLRLSVFKLFTFSLTSSLEPLDQI